MSGTILTLMTGFFLGILLMAFLISGREEEELLERVERTGPNRPGGWRDSSTGN